MAEKKTTREAEEDEELEEELDDEWEDEGQDSPGARLLRRFGEIRRRIFWIAGAIGVCAGIAGIFCTQIFDFLMRPLCETLPQGGAAPVGGVARLIAGTVDCAVYPTELLEPFYVYVKLAILVGTFAASPVIFYQLYQILSPYIPKQSRWQVVVFVLAATVFFVGGASFGFFLVFPKGFAFMRNMGGPNTILLQTMENYFKMTSLLLLGFGFSFELPLVMYLLSKLGVTNTRLYWRFWRHAVFALLVFAALICPTTDPFTVSALGLPLAGLYFLGIGLSKLGETSGPTLLERRLGELRELAGSGDPDEDEDQDDQDEEEEDEEQPGA